ncbi:MAG TPA: YitT family protein [Candidatus Eubacterium avistercoris]|uniref:YitT family protein n=1 Tax=Candidatus Eubacterium avistercoris TaxID=2838567 RepID=A0A9D2IF22_9FIRM|nr:YitT family protein [Candidatus Eubacterium avistercoris]
MDQKSETLRRYIVFFLGLLTTSFGVAFVTKATLGTSPIAAIPYSLSLILPVLSLGTWVVLFNLLLVVIQVAIQRKDTNKFQVFLEVIMAFLFGYGVDLAMLFLRKLSPEIYGLKLLVLLIGCFILAFGAYLEVIADVVMLPGDAFVRAIARAVRKEYGTVRIISDITMSVIAAIMCLIFLHQLSGVREGTIISALLVGNLVKLYSRKLDIIPRKLLFKKTV